MQHRPETGIAISVNSLHFQPRLSQSLALRVHEDVVQEMEADFLTGNRGTN